MAETIKPRHSTGLYGAALSGRYSNYELLEELAKFIFELSFE